jgi:hypothetical protein
MQPGSSGVEIGRYGLFVKIKAETHGFGPIYFKIFPFHPFAKS